MLIVSQDIMLLVAYIDRATMSHSRTQEIKQCYALMSKLGVLKIKNKTRIDDV